MLVPTTTTLREGVHLRSTISGASFPIAKLEEFAANGESLEVVIPDVQSARVRSGHSLTERYQEFLPFDNLDTSVSLGEGATPLLLASQPLQEFAGIANLLLKDETQNPTWSFKDRGTLTSIWMAQAMREAVTGTISTGNMGNSVAAYAARSGIRAIVFVPHYTPAAKVSAIGIHGATVICITADDYAEMKTRVLELGARKGLRIVSGNGPVRIEGYKLIAFELYEQLAGQVPDYIAVPTSACGHIRGLWKGWKELQDSGLTGKLPKMILVQAEANSPLVSAMRQGSSHVIPFKNFHTIAEAITSGNPAGGDEILDKAYRFGWLGETATEDEILNGQKRLARAGHFVEPATATSLHAIRKLRHNGVIADNATVVLMLTGSGLKDMDVMSHHTATIYNTTLSSLNETVERAIES